MSDSTWNGSWSVSHSFAPVGDYDQPANWTSGVPSVSDTAFFGVSKVTDIFVEALNHVGTWHFLLGASQYSFIVGGPPNLGGLDFSSSGSGIIVDGGSCHIYNYDFVRFEAGSSAGAAIIDNYSELDFDGSAGSSTITTQPGGRTFFDASSDAGNSTIVTLSGGTTEFENNASGRNALLITDAGGITEFRASSDGGNAQLIVNAGGVVDFSQSSGFSNGLIEAGSIAGAGTFQLGSDELIVGSNDLSTKVSGLITDSGLGGGSLAALDKVGTGMLTLSHVDNDYTGGTFLQAGTLALTAIGAAGPGHITFAGRATLKVGKAALSAHHFGNAIDDFAKHDVVDLTGLHFVAGAIATYHKATHHLAVRSGGVTDTLTLFSPHGTHFEAANDHHGGTDVFLIFA